MAPSGSAESVQTASLSVFKTDDAGIPQTGACFTAYGGRDAVEAQACDSSDGALDGVTTLRFPNGVPGGIDLVETSTPEGQTTSAQQSIGIDPGENQTQAVVARPLNPNLNQRWKGPDLP